MSDFSDFTNKALKKDRAFNTKTGKNSLLLNEEQFRRAIEEAPIPTIMQAEDGQVLQISRSWTELTGYKLGEMQPFDNWLTQIVYDGAENVRDHMHQLFNGTKSQLNIEFPICTTKGDLKTWSFSASSPGTLLDGRRFIVGMAVDITEQRKAKQALSKNEQEFIALVQASSNVVYRMSADWSEMRQLHGKNFIPDTREPSKIWLEKYVPEVDRAMVQKTINQAIQKNSTFELEHRVIQVDGSIGWVFSRAIPLLDEEGKIVEWLGMASDINERKQAEEQLRASREKYKSLFDSIDEGFCIIEVIFDANCKPIDYRFLEVNAIFEQQTGLHDAKGKLMRFLAPTHEEHWFRIYGEIALTGKPKKFEDEAKALNRYYEVYAFPIGKEKPHQVGILFKDIYERKKAEEALTKVQTKLQEYATGLEQLVEKRAQQVTSEQKRLYNVLDVLPVMVCLLTPDHHVAFENRSFRKKFGESKNKYCYDLCFGNKEPCKFCESYIVLETGQPHHWELKTPDGSIIDAYDFPFTDVDGSPMILEMDIDITARRKAEEQLRTSFSYARNLIEASLDPLVTISAEGKITDVNKATELVTDCSRSELIGSDFSNYFTDPEHAMLGYERVFKEGYVKDYPLVIRKKTGENIEVLYNAAVFRNETGQVQGVFAAARDVTERKKLEKQVKDSERLAAIGATAGMVGHDIRNPLQAIMSDTYLLKDALTAMPESATKLEVTESIDSIEKNIGYINKIVADLQDYARPLEPEHKDVDLLGIVTSVFQPINIPDNLTMNIDIEPSLIFKSDPTLLRRILTNLIINAMQAMPEGGKLCISGRPNLDGVSVIVEDTGVGIPEEVKAKLFTPMTTTKAKGQGLGLAVVKRLVEALGGTIGFESEVGRGTTFTVQLPVKK